MDSYHKPSQRILDSTISYAGETSAMETAPPAKTRKKKAPTLRVEDWEPYKARVLELHVAQDRPLIEVKAIMDQSGFKAEYAFQSLFPYTRLTLEFRIRQYKSILAKWGVGKNIRPREMKAIVRKRKTD